MEHINMLFNVEKDNYESAGLASSKIKKTLVKLGLESSVIRRIAVAAYEAEINLVIHSMGGTMEVNIFSDHISLLIKDEGPGIANLNMAMSEGFSTAGGTAIAMGFGAGMGLPNMKKCSDKFDIESSAGVGTKIEMSIYFTGGD